MSFGDQMKHKAEEVHLQAKAKDFGDAVAEMLKTAASIAASYAKENREKVDGALDKVEGTIEEKTSGKHSDTVTKVRASVDKGIDKLVERNAPQTPAAPTPGPTPGATPGATSGATPGPTPGPTPGAGSSVPDDRFSAFDDDAPAGSPS